MEINGDINKLKTATVYGAKARNREVQAKILVCVPSKGNPEYLMKSVSQLVYACSDRNNFDILLILDIGQESLYSEAISVLKPDIIKYIKPNSKTAWADIEKVKAETMLENNYYFYMLYSDDTYGINRDWDNKIIETMGTFVDDVFMLYTSIPYFGRSPVYHKNCWYDGTEPSLHAAATYGESLIIVTRKIVEYARPLFKTPERLFGLDGLAYTMIIHLLYALHKKNRNVFCDLSVEVMVNNDTSYHLYNKINKSFDDFKEVVNNINTNLKE